MLEKIESYLKCTDENDSMKKETINSIGELKKENKIKV